MRQAPPADVEVTADLARALLLEQHPDLAGLRLAVVAHGWDNVVLRLGDDLAVRVPRRREAARLVEHELQALPVLAPRLPVAVPGGVRSGRPSDALGYPWVWAVVRWADGVDAARLERAARAPLAEPLAEVLAALHAPAPSDAPHNPYRGVPLSARDADVRSRLARLAAPGGYLSSSGLALVPGSPGASPDASADGVGTAPDVEALHARLTEIWDAGVAAPAYDGPPLWLHGDLHAANLVVAAAAPHQLAAVVDWGDVTAGDPATDLAVAWLVLDAAARRRFWERLDATGYPHADDGPTRTRARAWGLTMATAMAEHATPGTGHHALATGALAELLAVAPPPASL